MFGLFLKLKQKKNFWIISESSLDAVNYIVKNAPMHVLNSWRENPETTRLLKNNVKVVITTSESCFSKYILNTQYNGIIYRQKNIIYNFHLLKTEKIDVAYISGSLNLNIWMMFIWYSCNLPSIIEKSITSVYFIVETWY